MGKTYIYNPYEMIKDAQAMREQSDTLSNLIKELQGVVTDMHAVWESPAQKVFESRFEELQPKLRDFCTGINGFADRAEQHARVVIKIEGGGNGPV